MLVQVVMSRGLNGIKLKVEIAVSGFGISDPFTGLSPKERESSLKRAGRPFDW
jgi:hypothetical protein